MNTASFLMKKGMIFSRTRMMMMLFGTIDFVGIKYFITQNLNAKIPRSLP